MKGSTSSGNKSVTIRLVSLVVLPLIALIIASGWLILDSVKLREGAKTTVLLAESAVKASALIHELQKERGMSAGFLGSKGKAFQQELPAQREKTDERYDELKTFISAEKALESDEQLASSLRNALDLVAQLGQVRNSIDGLQTDIAGAISHYTAANQHLIDVVAVLPKIAPSAHLASQTLPYLNLIYMKENAGIERAVLAGSFARDSFSDALYRKFVGLVEKQHVYQNTFEFNASPESRQRLKSALSTASAKDAEKMRQKALEIGIGASLAMDSKTWFDAQTGKINELKSVEDTLSENLIVSSNAMLDRASTNLWSILFFTGMAVVGTVFLGGNIARRLNDETTELVKALEAIAAGDLSDANVNYDKIGGARISLEEMRSKLTQINIQILESVDTLKSASREISDKNQSLASRAEKQGQHLETTSAGMDRITQTVKQNATDSNKGNQLARDAMDHASKGQSIVRKAVSAMAEINQDSKKIAEIINVIDDIAFQTNLLALNAAVEAARAGDQGRGFAVVASEVRNLAQRSADAAHEIKALIETSVKKVENGSQLVYASGTSLEGIVEAVEDCQKLMNQIAIASDEQAKGVIQINDAMSELDSTNQQNTAMVEEVAVSSQELQSQANKLAEITSFYKVDPSAHRAPFTSAFTGLKTRTKPKPISSATTPAKPLTAPRQVTETSKPFVERRSANRPWSDKTAKQAAAPVARAPTQIKKAVGDHEDWTTF